MVSYYYLISSLPTLKADAALPFSYKEFLEQCKSSVNKTVFSRLENLSLQSSKGPMLKEWGSFNTAFVNELNYQRKIKLGKDVGQSQEINSSIKKKVENVLNEKNPLLSEQLMLKYQFEYLDSLVAMHYFDDYVLFGYAIKIKLLERLNAFNQESGSAEFKRLFDNVQAQIMSI